MKRILSFFILAAAIVAAVSCSQPTEWNEQQRAEFVASIDPYRSMIYLNDLDDSEFVVFADNLSTAVEEVYPVYSKFIMLPALSDTVDMWVVTTIIDELDADATNMRHLYPYHNLVMQEILPASMDHAQKIDFYRCLAQKVDDKFTSLDAFFYAVITNAIDPNVITEMQKQCAAGVLGVLGVLGVEEMIEE